MRIRTGKSVIELLVVVGILGTLLGLLLPAVMMVREMAARIKCMNNHRQIGLALHSYAADNGGNLPFYRDTYYLPGQPHPPLTPHAAVLPYLEQRFQISAPDYVLGYRFVSPFVCPSDPNLSRILNPQNAAGGDETSVAMNYQVFGTAMSLNTSITDGLSTTLATAEHYAWCGTLGNGQVGPPMDRYFHAYVVNPGMAAWLPASFAGATLVYPVTKGNPPVSLGNDKRNPRITFQLRPLQAHCNPNVAQTPHTGGMVATFLDGSVRTIRSSIAPEVYWGATTPNRGEIITLD